MTKAQKILLVVVVAIVAGGWFFWFRHYQDRQRFERIELALKEIVGRFETNFSVSSKETIRYCSKGSRKFGEGPLTCHISMTFSDNNPLSGGEARTFLANQTDKLESTSVSYAFNLVEEQALCNLNNPANSKIVTDSFSIECTKQATKSHFQFVE